MDTATFNSVFWLAITSSLVGFFIVISKLIAKSKCKEVGCCCIKCIRDTEAEEREEEFRIEHQPQQQPSKENNDNIDNI